MRRSRATKKKHACLFGRVFMCSQKSKKNGDIFVNVNIEGFRPCLSKPSYRAPKWALMARLMQKERPRLKSPRKSPITENQAFGVILAGAYAHRSLPRSKQQVLEGSVRGKTVKGMGGGVPAEGGSTEKRSDVACDHKHVTNSGKRGADWLQLVVNGRRVLGRVAEAPWPWHGAWRCWGAPWLMGGRQVSKHTREGRRGILLPRTVPPAGSAVGRLCRRRSARSASSRQSTGRGAG